MIELDSILRIVTQKQDDTLDNKSLESKKQDDSINNTTQEKQTINDTQDKSHNAIQKIAQEKLDTKQYPSTIGSVFLAIAMALFWSPIAVGSGGDMNSLIFQSLVTLIIYFMLFKCVVIKRQIIFLTIVYVCSFFLWCSFLFRFDTLHGGQVAGWTIIFLGMPFLIFFIIGNSCYCKYSEVFSVLSALLIVGLYVAAL